MFKKLIIAAVLVLGLSASPAKAAALAPIPTPIVAVAGGGGAAFWPFLIATTGGLAVVILNAEGVPFPLCGVSGLQCFYEFPQDKHFPDQE